MQENAILRHGKPILSTSWRKSFATSSGNIEIVLYSFVFILFSLAASPTEHSTLLCLDTIADVKCAANRKWEE